MRRSLSFDLHNDRSKSASAFSTGGQYFFVRKKSWRERSQLPGKQIKSNSIFSARAPATAVPAASIHHFYSKGRRKKKRISKLVSYNVHNVLSSSTHRCTWQRGTVGCAQSSCSSPSAQTHSQKTKYVVLCESCFLLYCLETSLTFFRLLFSFSCTFY